MSKHTTFLTALTCGITAAGLMMSAPASAKVEGDTIVLGAPLSFTGKYATAGKHTKNGYDLAIAKINAAGGVKVGGKSYQFKVQYYDDESTSARTAQLVERLVKQDGIQYLLGPYGSGPTAAMAPVVEQLQVPMVEGNGASRSIFNKGYKYTFAVLSTSEQYLAETLTLAAEWAKDNGRDPSTLKVAMAMENDPFSQDIRAGLIDDAAKFGMKIVIDDKLPPELNDMSATLTKVKALKPDILAVSGHSKGATLVIRQYSEMKVDVPILSMTHCDSADIAKNFGDKAEYALCGAQWDPNMAYKDKLFGSARDYANTFEKAYGYAAPYQSAESSAAVQVYVDAFQRAKSLSPKDVRDALAATNMQTFYGNIDFDETGKNIAKPMVLLQVQGGKYIPVAPSKFAAAKAIIPIPTWDKR